MDTEKIRQVLEMVDCTSIIPIIRHGIKMEQLNLAANEALGYTSECLAIQNRIADARIIATILSGDTPLPSSD